MDIGGLKRRAYAREWANAEGCIVCGGPVVSDELICSGGCNDLFKIVGNHQADGYGYDGDADGVAFQDWE